MRRIFLTTAILLGSLTAVATTATAAPSPSPAFCLTMWNAPSRIYPVSALSHNPTPPALRQGARFTTTEAHYYDHAAASAPNSMLARKLKTAALGYAAAEHSLLAALILKSNSYKTRPSSSQVKVTSYQTKALNDSNNASVTLDRVDSIVDVLCPLNGAKLSVYSALSAAFSLELPSGPPLPVGPLRKITTKNLQLSIDQTPNITLLSTTPPATTGPISAARFKVVWATPRHQVFTLCATINKKSSTLRARIQACS